MTVAELKVKLGADVTDFDKKMSSVQKKMQAVGKRMTKIGKTMSLAITAPLTAMAVVSVAAFDTQIQAENKLRAALKANGEQVEATFRDYKKFASELQNISTVGDESTLQLLQVAQSMGLSGDAAKLAAKEAIAIAKAMGMSEQSAIRYTAALAQGDATMLRRYLPSLRDIEDQSEMTAEAHRLLAGMFATVTAEAADGLGPLKQLKNSFGDLLEQFGEIIARGMKPLIDKLKKLVGWFQTLSPATKKIIVIVGGLVAAIGPLLIVMGVLISTVIPAIITGLAALWASMLAHPLGILITAIGLIAGAFLLFRDRAKEASLAQRALSKANKEAEISLSKQKVELDSLLIAARNNNLSLKKRKEAISEINKKYPEYLGNLKLEEINSDKAKEAIKRLTEALWLKAKATAYGNKLIEIETDRINTLDKILSQSTKGRVESSRRSIKVIDEEKKAYVKAKKDMINALNLFGASQYEINSITERLNKRKEDANKQLKEEFGLYKALKIDLDKIIISYKENYDAQEALRNGISGVNIELDALKGKTKGKLDDDKKQIDIVGKLTDRETELSETLKELIAQQQKGIDTGDRITETRNKLFEVTKKLKDIEKEYNKILKERTVTPAELEAVEPEGFDEIIIPFDVRTLEGAEESAGKISNWFGQIIDYLDIINTDKLKAFQEGFKKVGSIVMDLGSRIGNIFAGIFANQMMRLDMLHQKEIELADKKNERLNAEQERLDEKFNLEMAKINSKYEDETQREIAKQLLLKRTEKEQQKIDEARKKAEAEKAKIENQFNIARRKATIKQAKLDKASALMSAIVGGAVAVVSALSIPPPVGLVLAALVAGLVATQIGVVASTPIPQMAEGGIIRGQTLVNVGENPRVNPEVIAPLSELKKYLSPPTQELVAKISAEDIYIILKRREHNLSYV